MPLDDLGETGASERPLDAEADDYFVIVDDHDTRDRSYRSSGGGPGVKALYGAFSQRGPSQEQVWLIGQFNDPAGPQSLTSGAVQPAASVPAASSPEPARASEPVPSGPSPPVSASGAIAAAETARSSGLTTPSTETLSR